MRQLKDVLRLKLESHHSHQRIAQMLGRSKGVVTKYVKLAAAAGLTWPQIQDMDETVLHNRLLTTPVRTSDFVTPDYAKLHLDLGRKGMTLMLLWQEHAEQHPGQAIHSYSQFCENSSQAEDWVRQHAVALLEGRLSGAAAGMRRSATNRKLSKKDREALDKCATYLLKNKSRFDYARALENGWPIATGIIEGACRHLVKDRMDLTGARWSLNGAEAVLQLRALHCSGDLVPYLQFHFEQEKIRNYSGLQAANEIFKMAA